MKKLFTFIGIALCFFVLSSSSLHAQISVAVTGYTNTTPNLASSYASLSAAITALNGVSAMSGPVVFNLLAGGTETSPVGGFVLGSASLNAVTSATNTITFIKSGAGANPLITSFVGTSTTVDGIWKIQGTDYVTIDGIDLQESAGNATATTQMEWGYALVKLQAATPFDGCQYVTIQNCTITLRKANTASVGIYTGNHIATATTSLTITATTDAHNNNRFYSNTITNVYVGIRLAGFAAATPYTLYDQNNEIGNGAGTGNNITNYGGGSATAYGIYTIYQSGLLENYNTINGGTATTTTLYGIYNSTANNANLTIRGNTVTIQGGATTSSIYAISNATGGTGTTNTLNIYDNTILNCTYTTATSGVLYLLYNSASAYNINIYNNTIRNNAKSGTSGSMYLLYNSALGANGNENIYNNNIYSNTCSGSGTLYILYSNSVSTAIKNIYGNNIYSITGGGSIQSLNQTLGTTVRVYNNKIYDINSTSALTTSGLIRGMVVGSGTNVYFYNNYISELKAPSSTGIDAIRGIDIASTSTFSTIGVYYNSIYLNASSSGANFGTSGIFHSASTTSTTATLDMRNNIVVNNSTPSGTGFTAAYRRSTTSLSNYGSSSNNNLFYAGTPSASRLIFYDGTNSDLNIADYKTRVTPRDAASFTENPPFVNVSTSPYDLHLQTTIPTQCESGGTVVSSPIAITTDYDGNIRNVTTPDVGADEGTFIGSDMTAPTISYTALANTTGTGNRTLTTSITDVSGVPTSGLGLPVLYWRINAGAYTAVTATYIIGSTYEFTFGAGVTTGDVVSYYVVAQDLAGTPNVGAYPSAGAGGFSANPPAASTPPTTPSTYTIISAPLSGDYTVGILMFNKITGKNITFEKVVTKVMKEIPVYEEENKDKEFTNKIIGTRQIEVEEISWIPMENGKKYEGDLFVKKSDNPKFNYPMGVNGIYATITAAVADLNLRGVSGPVRFLLNDATYTTGETYPITVDIISSDLPTATNTVTIKPSVGVTSSISGASTSSIFKLNGADYIIIDGSNAVSGTTKDMTITNTSVTGAVIWLASKGTGAGCNTNTIKNCVINGGSLATGNYGITVGGATIGTTGDDNDNLTIQNNTITKEYYGIYLASSVSGTSDGLNITGNLIGSNTATDYVQFKGIYITGAPSANISQNEIFNIQTTGSINNAGIEIIDNSSNTVISSNKIYGLRSTSTSGYGSYGINIAPASGTTGVTISNNLIYDIITSNYSATSTTWNAFGIRLAGGTGHKVYYNSVNLFGAVSGGTAAGMSAPFLVTASTITGLDVRNNIFANSTGFTVVGAKAYCAYIPTGTVFSSINYNDYYPSGTYGILGYYGADQTTITAWRTASGQDANSGSGNPQFISNTDLHINTSSPTIVSNAGTPIGSVTTDYDGETRNATTPDIGADEGNFIPLANMVYTSSTTTQVTGSVLPGTTNQQVIRIEVVTTNALNPLTALQFDVNANGTSDINDINVSTAKIYYTGTSSTFSTGTLFGQEIPTTSPDFIITGSQVLAEGTNYFWLAYDIIPAASNGNFIDGECNIVGLNSGSYTPTITAPSGYREIVGPMAGTYYVGQGYTSPNFATITAAFADLQLRGVSGAVNLVLTNNAATPYNTANGETFPLSLNTISGASGTNTITMKPNTGVQPIIQGSSTNAIIKLNGTDYFTLDGSNSGSTDRSLTIENTNTAATTAGIWLSSAGVGAGATYNTVKNCNIKTGNIGTAANTFGIFVGGATINSGGSDNDNNTIQNNAISKAYYGIDVYGITGSTSDNLTITGNSIGSNTSTDYITYRGMYISYSTSVTISQNTIFNVINSTETQIIRGIEIGTGVLNSTISRNNIYNIQNLTTTLFRSGQGISLSTGSATSNITIDNNLLHGFRGHGSGTATNNMWGIIILGGGSYNIYYNSINLYNNGTTTGSVDRNGCLYIAASVTSLNIRNNAFSTTGNPGNASAGFMYNIYSLSANTAFTAINYNDYYVAGTRGFVGYINALDQATLAAWQTATAQDANSISSNPIFTSNSDLRPALNSPLLLAGTPVAITIDYLGVSRSLTTPAIGAYEYGVDAAGPSISYSLLTNTTSTANRTLSGFATITDFSGINTTSGTAPRIYYKKTTDANTYVGNTAFDNGWKWAEATNTASPFDFTIDYSIIFGGSVALNDYIQYFIVAQDLFAIPNVSINSGTFAAAPVSVNLTSAAFPLTGTINQYKIVGGPLAGGTYTVGLSAFNKVTGKNLYFEKMTRTISNEKSEKHFNAKQEKTADTKKQNNVTKELKSDKTNADLRDNNGSLKPSPLPDDMTVNSCTDDISDNRSANVKEDYYVLMENGKPYTGEKKVIFDNDGVNNVTKKSELDAPNGVYSTITEAMNDLSDRGISGAVTFLLVDATYLTETYPFVISSVGGVSATNTVTIKPATGISPVISGSSSSAPIFKIFNTNYVTIDGSNNGTTTRDMTIENTSITTPQVIWIGSSGTTPITNVTVKNCNIKNGINSSSAVVISDGNASGTAGYFNNITIQNNSIKQAYIGLYCITVVAAGNGSGTLITGNDLNSSGADAVRLVGIYLQGIDGCTVSNNNIGNNTNTLDASNITGIWLATGTWNGTISGNTITTISGSAGAPRGIYLSGGVVNSNIVISGNTINALSTASTGESIGIAVTSTTTGVNISKNRISDISNSNTGGYDATGINLSSSSTTAAVNVTNNVIYNVYGYGWASQTTDNGYGIYIGTGGGYNLYYNSICLTTEQTLVTGVTACLMISSSITTAGSLDIRNNIFQTNQTIGTNRYAICCNAANIVFSNLNYNNYYTSGPNLGYIGATDRAALTNWRAGSMQDLFSISGNSGFTSSTNLQPDAANANCWTVNGGAYPIATVTDDYLGNSRNTTVGQGPEDIGAYKVVPSVEPNAVGISGAITDGGTTTLTFAGTTIATITWHAGAGTLPTSISAVFKPGNIPPGTPYNSYAFEYLDITETGGVLPYTYDLTVYYNLSRTYTINISPEDNLRVAKYSGAVWNMLDLNTTTNSTTKTVAITGIDNGFSSFTFTGNDSPLPVQLTSFISSVSGRDVKLTWKTESELNNAGFEIQRIKNSELNSGRWTNVGYVKSAGNSNTPVTYAFEDKKLNSGKFNYRLKQIDKSGAYKYFSLNNVIDIALPTDYRLSQNYPNPFNPTTKIDFELPFDSKVRLTIYDMLGREVKTLISGEMKQAGFYTVELNGTNLSSGTYFYRMIANGQNKDNIFTKKMVIVK